MNLDPRTIVLITILSVLLTGGGLLAVSRGYLGQVRGTSEWALATLMQAVGWIIVSALRGVLPDLVSIVAGNALILASLAWYLAILAQFVDRRVHAFWIYGVTVFGIGALAYFAQASPNLTARNIVMSACVAALALKSAEVLWSGAAARRASHLFMAAILTLCGVFMALRTVVYLVWNPDPGSVAFAMNTINQISLLVFYVVAVLLTFGFILMCNDAYIAQQHQAERAQANRVGARFARSVMPGRRAQGAGRCDPDGAGADQSGDECDAGAGQRTRAHHPGARHGAA